jgi:ABC-2 type transport system ATP-binding protein
VKNASLVIKKGEVVGFVGANGAGKTTTISMLLGFLNASVGEVKLFDEVIHPQDAHSVHGHIGYAAGDMELPAHLTGKQYLSFLMHQTDADHTEQYTALCKRFVPELNKKIHELSRGNKQKIALIAAFITNPEVVILDEPTSGLDPVMQEAFLDLIRDYQVEGKTVFMSSHYLQEVIDVCSRVILMRKGVIIQDVQTKDLLASSGKLVKITTEYLRTQPPKKAESVEVNKVDSVLQLSFVYKGSLPELQTWLASIKHLQDIEINEHSLESMFHSLYEHEGQDEKEKTA